MSDTIKYTLDESAIPKTWYNLVADLPVPPPPVLHPGTGQPIGPTATRRRHVAISPLAVGVANRRGGGTSSSTRPICTRHATTLARQTGLTCSAVVVGTAAAA